MVFSGNILKRDIMFNLLFRVYDPVFNGDNQLLNCGNGRCIMGVFWKLSSGQAFRYYVSYLQPYNFQNEMFQYFLVIK